MAIIVEHEKRKIEILEKALDVFIADGYDDVTYQKIADKCNITRTTLYIYFKNKREIFVAAIKQFSSILERSILDIMKDPSNDSVDCLEKMFLYLVDTAEKYGMLFKVLQSYLMQLEKGGDDVDSIVSRRVIRVQHMTNTLIIRGQNKGEIKKDISIKDINSALYGVLESAILRLAILNQPNLERSKSTVRFLTNTIRSN